MPCLITGRPSNLKPLAMSYNVWSAQSVVKMAGNSLLLLQVTQLGHVKDLATAFVKVLDNPKASKQVYNISGERFVTFDGIAKACAAAAGAPEPELVHYNPKDFDFGGKKSFPLRDQHFFTSISKVILMSLCPPSQLLLMPCQVMLSCFEHDLGISE